MQFEELSNSAKEKARSFVREHWLHDWNYEDINDDIRNVFKCFGITAKCADFCWVVGGQGEYFTFSGQFTMCSDLLQQVKAYAPRDEELHRIACDFVALGTAAILQGVKFEGRIRRLYRQSISFEPDDETAEYEPMCDTVFGALCNWALRQLRESYEYEHSDENVDAILEDREFEEDGSII